MENYRPLSENKPTQKFSFIREHFTKQYEHRFELSCVFSSITQRYYKKEDSLFKIDQSWETQNNQILAIHDVFAAYRMYTITEPDQRESLKENQEFKILLNRALATLNDLNIKKQKEVIPVNLDGGGGADAAANADADADADPLQDQGVLLLEAAYGIPPKEDVPQHSKKKAPPQYSDERINSIFSSFETAETRDRETAIQQDSHTSKVVISDNDSFALSNFTEEDLKLLKIQLGPFHIESSIANLRRRILDLTPKDLDTFLVKSNDLKALKLYLSEQEDVCVQSIRDKLPEESLKLALRKHKDICDKLIVEKNVEINDPALWRILDQLFLNKENLEAPPLLVIPEDLLPGSIKEKVDGIGDHIPKLKNEHIKAKTSLITESAIQCIRKTEGLDKQRCIDFANQFALVFPELEAVGNFIEGLRNPPKTDPNRKIEKVISSEGSFADSADHTGGPKNWMSMKGKHEDSGRIYRGAQPVPKIKPLKNEEKEPKDIKKAKKDIALIGAVHNLMAIYKEAGCPDRFVVQSLLSIDTVKDLKQLSEAIEIFEALLNQNQLPQDPNKKELLKKYNRIKEKSIPSSLERWGSYAQLADFKLAEIQGIRQDSSTQVKIYHVNNGHNSSDALSLGHTKFEPSLNDRFKSNQRELLEYLHDINAKEHPPGLREILELLDFEQKLIDELHPRQGSRAYLYPSLLAAACSLAKVDIYVHCESGKDRTGFVMDLIQKILDKDDDGLVELVKSQKNPFSSSKFLDLIDEVYQEVIDPEQSTALYVIAQNAEKSAQGIKIQNFEIFVAANIGTILPTNTLSIGVAQLVDLMASILRPFLLPVAWPIYGYFKKDSLIGESTRSAILEGLKKGFTSEDAFFKYPQLYFAEMAHPFAFERIRSAGTLIYEDVFKPINSPSEVPYGVFRGICGIVGVCCIISASLIRSAGLFAASALATIASVLDLIAYLPSKALSHLSSSLTSGSLPASLALVPPLLLLAILTVPVKVIAFIPKTLASLTYQAAGIPTFSQLSNNTATSLKYLTANSATGPTRAMREKFKSPLITCLTNKKMNQIKRKVKQYHDKGEHNTALKVATINLLPQASHRRGQQVGEDKNECSVYPQSDLIKMENTDPKTFTATHTISTTNIPHLDKALEHHINQLQAAGFLTNKLLLNPFTNPKEKVILFQVLQTINSYVDQGVDLSKLSRFEYKNASNQDLQDKINLIIQKIKDNPAPEKDAKKTSMFGFSRG